MSFWDTKELFQKLPFYNTFIEKQKIKHLSNIEFLHELLFYVESFPFTLKHFKCFRNIKSI